MHDFAKVLRFCPVISVNILLDFIIKKSLFFSKNTFFYENKTQVTRISYSEIKNCEMSISIQ